MQWDYQLFCNYENLSKAISFISPLLFDEGDVQLLG